MNHKVYIHRNKINGKMYVGITKNDVTKRWNAGHGYFRNKHFSDAIKKYGWDNFEHFVVLQNVDRETACYYERKLIAKYKTQDKRFGYNITDGGEHFVHTEESKRLMSERRKGKGQHVFSEEHKRKIKEHHAGGAECVAVFCVETGKSYKSINDASRDTGINKKQISGCCRNVPHFNTAGGLHWQFARG